MITRRALVALPLVAAMALLSMPAHAIIVEDLIAEAQSIQTALNTAKTWVTENLSWLKQVQQYATQLQQYKTEVMQLAAFVHDPSLGAVMGVLQMAGLGNSLPVSPYAVMGLVGGAQSITAGGGFNLGQITGVLGQLSSFAGTSYSTNHVYSPTDGSFASKELIANGNSLAGTQGAALSAYNDLRTHQSALDGLRQRSLEAGNPLDQAVVGTNTNIENTWTTNLNGQVSALALAERVQEKERQQRDNEQWNQSLDEVIAKERGAFGF